MEPARGKIDDIASTPSSTLLRKFSNWFREFSMWFGQFSIRLGKMLFTRYLHLTIFRSNAPSLIVIKNRCSFDYAGMGFKLGDN